MTNIVLYFITYIINNNNNNNYSMNSIKFSSFARLLLFTIVPLLLLLPLTESVMGTAEKTVPAIAPTTTTTTNTTISPTAPTSASNQNCLSYDPSNKIITIKCKSATLTDIDNQLNDDSILDRQANNGVWLLNAGILVDKGAVLKIDSKDVKWLKIIADGKTAYSIDVLGGLKIDSVKITSWNPRTNNYATTNGTRDLSDNKVVKGDPRPYIRVEDEATGTTDITNSEIAYLGYESGVGGGKQGLRYDGGNGSVLKGNNIHHLYFGFYSSGVGGMVVVNNHIHHNGHYGFDPHTGTHHMIFRNNIVDDNGGIGLICSLDCHHITIENNKIYSNAKRGIMLSRNMSDSIARNNIISNEENAITISESHHNKIYNNTVSDSEGGIDIDKESLNNAIYNNTMIVANATQSPQSSSDAIAVEKGAEKNNEIFSNKIINSNRIV
jgi:parallel beta-helix repeat protein